ncbi:threonine-phosphate decarboxylase CobD [Oceanobacillus jeddahense]|uniref:threonine-phosphate decarboxylase n=1 Tax=Oceanobacillus jeddahense TaxID=1462527 RepID=A0ABY5JVP8_9BACI|nr:threonine-phosphate decarboxylase CobD [Oceanobacillus jeddahense]UUI02649.1 threonine-phosphate decarboxylase CobD [Oceanobacillus jeddahense]
MQLPAHGSNTKYVYDSLGMKQPEQIIDFSVNTNPLGAPEVLREKWDEWFDVINDYPDPYANNLMEQLAVQENIPVTHLLAGNGAAEIITLIARYLTGSRVAVIHPAFSEYATACENEDCEVIPIVLSEPDWNLDAAALENQLQGVKAVFLCNPNNPTGMHYQRETVEAFMEICKKTNTLCIIDEAFYDFLPEPVTYIKTVLHQEHVLIIRSLTKMYSIAGLRLGFLAGNPALLQKISKSKPHWSVNALAMKAGIACLQDKAHVAETRKFIEAERAVIFQKLEELGFEYSLSRLNFYLLRDPALPVQKRLFQYLLKQGLVLRHTENFPGIEGKRLRVAVKQPEANKKLLEALTVWKQEN